MVDRIQVLIGEMPQMLRDIIERTLDDQHDIEVIADVSGSRSAAEDDGGPDVVLLSTEDIEQFEAAADWWLTQWPRARILVIEHSGRHAVLCELRPHATRLGELSAEQLVELIRFGAVRSE